MASLSVGLYIDLYRPLEGARTIIVGKGRRPTKSANTCQRYIKGLLEGWQL